MENIEAKAHIELCWKQIGGLVHALEGCTRISHISSLMKSDEKLGDLEAKANGIAEALHEIRLLRRLAR